MSGSSHQAPLSQVQHLQQHHPGAVPPMHHANPGAPPGTSAPTNQKVDRSALLQLVLDLTSIDKRENALNVLSKQRDSWPDLAPVLWFSCGTMAALLLEITSIYPMLSPPALTAPASNRVCNALALLQSVASHADTRTRFLNAHIPLYLYPLLNTLNKARSFEYLRLTSLGVIGALVKTNDSEVISFLLNTEIIPLCLRIMESGSELSRTVATFIVQKILLDDNGLVYICQTYERFSHVALVLSKMVYQLARSPSSRLLKHVIHCYVRLSANSRAREALRQCLPEPLKGDFFDSCLRDDHTTRRWLSELVANLSRDGPTNGHTLSPAPPKAGEVEYKSSKRRFPLGVVVPCCCLGKVHCVNENK
ncbi:uncharacterized protein MONBRDRAFT_29867 [Monosiga brevicollis MX1]|uniref:CCR4-NOT transcription complex subunit 9 n=1 Tax=Monosiga brevicollis TaxID=81824 RepID=A9VCC9_MONBE|nr:uncharacterized protein MONBRDRAFT_29867 [Monosiga brevicollis MX1]EDQ84878.1 predicted protein [Monosiga brevicollis MX1]|eukprot:XP_001750379.1 hypothetical protein [Monosiga brevicollis MX1]